MKHHAQAINLYNKYAFMIFDAHVHSNNATVFNRDCQKSENYKTIIIFTFPPVSYPVYADPRP